MLDRREDRQPELSVVVPVLNESENIRPLLQRLVPVLERAARSFEIIFVDDGSSDDTLDIVRALHATEGRIAAISFSRRTACTARSPARRRSGSVSADRARTCRSPSK